jgi:hypothetical protein
MHKFAPDVGTPSCGLRSANPKGIPAQSPGLRGTSYPGKTSPPGSTPKGLQPEFVPSDSGASTPSGLIDLTGPTRPRVARSSQPWADRHNPLGIELSYQEQSAVVLGLLPGDVRKPGVDLCTPFAARPVAFLAFHEPTRERPARSASYAGRFREFEPALRCAAAATETVARRFISARKQLTLT